MRHKFTDEQIAFIKKEVQGKGENEFQTLFNQTFNTDLSISKLANAKSRYGVSSGTNGGRFIKGQKSWNKGVKGYMGANVTSFQKGHTPHNHRPIGSERVDKNGLIEIKVAEPNVWRGKQRVVYEQHYGQIPKGTKIIFADRNNRNFDIDNLIAVKNSELARLNQSKLIFENGELTKTGLNIVKLKTAIHKRSVRNQ